MEPATYFQEPSRISMILSRHLTADGVSPPLLQNPSPTLYGHSQLSKVVLFVEFKSNYAIMGFILPDPDNEAFPASVVEHGARQPPSFLRAIIAHPEYHVGNHGTGVIGDTVRYAFQQVRCLHGWRNGGHHPNPQLFYLVLHFVRQSKRRRSE